jgi:hypothetical protein
MSAIITVVQGMHVGVYFFNYLFACGLVDNAAGMVMC